MVSETRSKHLPDVSAGIFQARPTPTPTESGPELEEINMVEISRNSVPSGSGAFGLIFKATYKGEAIALKQLRAYSAPNTLGVPERDRRRFYREAYIWCSLRRHPNILPLLGITRDPDGAIYMISPWIKHGHLNSYLCHHQGESFGFRLNIVLGIARGLHFLHRNMIVHGDLRGDNILISEEGHAQISDFGLSLALDKLALAAHATSMCGVGAVRWMAPELFEISSRPLFTMESDVWSFGMAVIEIFTGRRPFDDQKVNDFLIAEFIRKSNRPQRPMDLEPSCAVSDELWELLGRCWNNDPEARPTARTVVRQVKNMKQGSAAYSDISSVQSVTIEPNADLASSPDITNATVITGQVTRTGRYPVASGGFTTVWLGEWQPLHFPPSRKIQVALKSLRGSTHVTWELLLREARLLSRLKHPNIVPLYGITRGDDDESALYSSLVSPWYPEGNVFNYLENHPDADRLAMVIDIARGLVYLHTLVPMIVHGNMKCTNILVASSGRAALCDFGLSAIILEGGSRSHATNSLVDGSVRYVAPELMSGEAPRATAESDVWGFGCIASKILYDCPLFQGWKDIQVCQGLVRGLLPAQLLPVGKTIPPAQFVNNILSDTELRQLVQDCWDYTPTRRPHMRDVLRSLTGEISTSNPIVLSRHASHQSELVAVPEAQSRDRVPLPITSASNAAEDPTTNTKGSTNWLRKLRHGVRRLRGRSGSGL